MIHKIRAFILGQRRKIIIGSILVVLVFIDQASKSAVRHFDGRFLCNPNIAWSIPVWPFLFWLIWIVIIGVVVWKLIYSRTLYSSFPLVFILSGAISNSFDRLKLGCVVDFIDVGFWPVFNIADSLIVMGGTLLLVRYWKK